MNCTKKEIPHPIETNAIERVMEREEFGKA
jgi:hypothetical protein